jgi:hypothetical protein
MKDYDFSGWATKNDILCDDGRIIKKNAFKDCDGVTVPLVYNHDHKNIGNVLGHCVLENRDDGVYCYGYLDKDTKEGQDALAHIKNGSMKSLSIYANKLKEVGHNVIHGIIREVSLVLAGANKGAVIDTVLAHASETTDDEGEGLIVTMGDETELCHSTTDDDGSSEFDLDSAIDSMNDDQKKAMLIMASMMAEDMAKQDNVSHSSKDDDDDDDLDDEDDDDDDDEESELEHSKDEDDEKKKSCSHSFSLFSSMTAKNDDEELSHAKKSEEDEDDDEDDEDDDDIDDSDIDSDDEDDEEDDDEEEEINSKNQNDKEKKEMKHNLFENEAQGEVLIHSAEACSEMMQDAVKFGSLKDSVMAHAADYGIDNIDLLFPNAKNYTTQPEFIKRRTEWVNEVLTGVRQSPFSRVKTIFADITEDEARAKGYIKGNRKAEEVFTLLKRETTPTTVYKKQRIDRDDIIDITDFSVIEFIKQEMRIMYDEECARAILVGDGRNPLSPDKIKEANIRPIWTDDDLFTIKRAIAVTTATTDQNRAKAFIKNLVKSRKQYRGSGNPTLFIQEDLLADMLLIEDTTGRLIYDSIDKLKNTLRVSKIVEVPVFDGLYRNDNGDTKYLAAILVNLNDYRTGRDKGGELSFFDDFDIDFNQQKYLMESRFSGALVLPYSAIAFEFVYNLTLEVQAKDSSAVLLGKQVSELQEQVFVNDNSIQGILNYVTGYTQFSGDPAEQEGHYIALQFEASEGAVVKIQTIGGLNDSRIVTLDSDMDAVIYVKSTKEKLRITCELNGDVLTKTLSFSGLKLLAQ